MRVIKTGLVVLGTFLLALSVEMFILPYNILSGGVAGISVALEPFLHINKTLLANGLVIVLLGLGTAVLGKEFFVQTAVSSLCYPVFTTLLERMITVPEIEPLLASFYGGLVGGIGIGLVLRTGASTGGMDIPPMIVNKITGIKLATLVLITDGITVLLGLTAYDLSSVLMGLISVMSMSFAINIGMNMGGSACKSVQIISDHWEEINKMLTIDLDRGVTIMDGVGGYTGIPHKVILCVVSQSQYNRLLENVSKIDKDAFIITTDTTDIHGEGFTNIFRI